MSKLSEEGIKDEWARDHMLQCALELRRRGWTLAALGERMKMTPQQVEGALERHRKRELGTDGKKGCADLLEDLRRVHGTPPIERRIEPHPPRLVESHLAIIRDGR